MHHLVIFFRNFLGIWKLDRTDASLYGLHTSWCSDVSLGIDPYISVSFGIFVDSALPDASSFPSSPPLGWRSVCLCPYFLFPISYSLLELFRLFLLSVFYWCLPPSLSLFTSSHLQPHILLIDWLSIEQIDLHSFSLSSILLLHHLYFHSHSLSHSLLSFFFPSFDTSLLS